MTFRSPSLRELAERSDVKLAALGLSAVAAVWLGFIGMEVKPAERFLMRAGYHVMTLTFVLWLATLYRLWRERSPASVSASAA